MSDFVIVPGGVVKEILTGAEATVRKIVRRAYIDHDKGLSVNPGSYFLRFADKPDARVIALPCYLGADVDLIGLKWISSFPGNTRSGKPRASGVLLLNDYETGRPIACIEAAGISAGRTAASVVETTTALMGRMSAKSVAFVGAGVIARTVVDYLSAGHDVGEVRVHDVDKHSADRVAEYARKASGAVVHGCTLERALSSDCVIFTTTASRPYVPVDAPIFPGQVLMNVSLRDLPPELLLKCNNVVDDIEHCLRAETSPHLAEKLAGSRDFVSGTIGSLLQGRLALDADRPTVVSPFGLGILDVAVGRYVLDEARRRAGAVVVPDFIGDEQRW